MTICHITINPIDYERRIKNQAESAAESGHRIWIIALGREGERREEDNIHYRLFRIKTPFGRGGPLKFIHFNLKLIFFLFNKKITAIHCHDLWVLSASALICWFKSIPLIYDAHEFYAGLELFVRKKVRRRIWLFVEKTALHKVSAVLTVSAPLAEFYLQRYPRIKRIDVIRNLPKFEPVRATKIPVESESKTIVYQGHFRPGRGLENLVKAMQHVEDGRLLLIGGGELATKLVEQVKKLSLQDRVTFKGYLPTDELIGTAAKSDLGVALFEPTSINYAYALPNKFFEYVMAGIPVLASHIQTFSEYIERYKFGMTVDPSDIDAIGKTINMMLHDEEKWSRWRENAISAARELNWENEAGKLEEIYREI